MKNMTKRYYALILTATPIQAALIAFSKINPLLSLTAGLISTTLSVLAGYFLGKR